MQRETDDADEEQFMQQERNRLQNNKCRLRWTTPHPTHTHTFPYIHTYRSFFISINTHRITSAFIIIIFSQFSL